MTFDINIKSLTMHKLLLMKKSENCIYKFLFLQCMHSFPKYE